MRNAVYLLPANFLESTCPIQTPVLGQISSFSSHKPPFRLHLAQSYLSGSLLKDLASYMVGLFSLTSLFARLDFLPDKTTSAIRYPLTRVNN